MNWETLAPGTPVLIATFTADRDIAATILDVRNCGLDRQEDALTLMSIIKFSSATLNA